MILPPAPLQMKDKFWAYTSTPRPLTTEYNRYLDYRIPKAVTSSKLLRPSSILESECRVFAVEANVRPTREAATLHAFDFACSGHMEHLDKGPVGSGVMNQELAHSVRPHVCFWFFFFFFFFLLCCWQYVFWQGLSASVHIMLFHVDFVRTCRAKVLVAHHRRWQSELPF